MKRFSFCLAFAVFSLSAWAQVPPYVHMNMAAGNSYYRYNQPLTGSESHSEGGVAASGTTDSHGLATEVSGLVTGTLSSPNWPASLTNTASASVSHALLTNHMSDFTDFTNYSGGYPDFASSMAQIRDHLDFTITGAGASTVTDVLVTYTMAGTININNPGNDNLVAAYNPYGDVAASVHMSGTANFDFNSDVRRQYGVSAVQYADCYPSGVIPTYLSNTTNLIIMSQYMHLTGPSASGDLNFTQTMSTEFGIDMNYSTWITMSLPSNVTMTSSSGRFLAAPVPEPSSWILLALGSAAIMRKRRSNVK